MDTGAGRTRITCFWVGFIATLGGFDRSEEAGMECFCLRPPCMALANRYIKWFALRASWLA